MLITNKITDYTSDEVAEMQTKITEFATTIKELDAILEKEALDPTTPKDEADNVIYIDPSIITEHDKYAHVALPLHEMLNVYDRWIEKYNYMIKVNIGQYKSQQLVLFLVKIRNACISFGTENS